MEKIKLQNNKEFELIINGISSTKDILTMQLLPGELALNDLESIFESTYNIERIELLSAEGEILNIYNGYVKISDIKKQKNVVIGYSELGETEIEAMKGDLIILTLKKPDRVDRLQSDVDYLALMSGVELE